MARLKVKQISDFTSAVNNLIGSGQVAVDDSIDSLESQLSEGLDSLGVIDSAISNALSTEIATTDTQVGSLEVIDSAVSNALSTEIATTDTEVGSLELIDSAVSNALATLDTTVGNIDIASLEAIDSAVSNAVAGILQGADADTDNFSEVISYINSVDAASDLDLVNEMTSVDTRFGSVDTRFGVVNTDIGSLEVIDSAISNALSTEIATTNTEIGSLELIDSAVSTALSNLQNNVGDIDQPSLEAIDSAVSNALSTEIATTDTEVGSLEVIDSAISNALSTEIATTDTEIGSLELIDSAVSQALATLDTTVGNIDIASLEVIDSAVSNALSTEIATTDTEVVSLETIDSAISTALSTEIATTGTEIDALQDSVDSLESQLNGFAKEAYIHLAATGLVSGNGATSAVLDTTGANVGDNVTEATQTYIFDLAIPIEGNNTTEMEANLVWVKVNGLGVDHNAVRVNNSTSWTLLESSLGYQLEASDLVEFKYIRD